MLLERGPDLEARSLHDETPLLVAAHQECTEAKGVSGETPMLRANGQGNPKILSLLLRKGADIGARDFYGQTALLLAVKSFYPENISLLLDKGADIGVKDFNGQTALMLVVSTPPHDAVGRRVKQATIELLLENGAPYS